jgi:hypothetical protein
VQLAIPPTPRAVTLAQVPGALGRVGATVAVAMVLVAASSFGGRWLGQRLSNEREFFERADEVTGYVISVTLPPVVEREGAVGTFSAVYVVGHKRHSASGLEVDAIAGEELAKGAKVSLLVDPENVEHPREANLMRQRAGVLPFAQGGVALGLLVGFAGVFWELRRAFRRELEPLRNGMLVWLTPPGELPKTRTELVFPAHYYREDVRVDVTARVRPGRAPVRKDEKLLAAVIPSQPTWVRVIDEGLAKTLGWYRE